MNYCTVRVCGKLNTRLEIFARGPDIEFDRDWSIGLGTTFGNITQTDGQIDTHTYTEIFSKILLLSSDIGVKEVLQLSKNLTLIF